MIYPVLKKGVSSFMKNHNISFVNELFDTAKTQGFSIRKSLNVKGGQLVKTENKPDDILDEEMKYDIRINHLDGMKNIMIETFNKDIIDYMRFVCEDHLEENCHDIFSVFMPRIIRATMTIDINEEYMLMNFYIFQKKKPELKDSVKITIVFRSEIVIGIIVGEDNTHLFNNVVRRLPVGAVTREFIDRYPLKIFSFSRDIESLISFEKNIINSFVDAKNMINASYEEQIYRLKKFNYSESNNLLCPVIVEIPKKRGNRIEKEYVIRESKKDCSKIKDIYDTIICAGLNLRFEYLKDNEKKDGEVKIVFKNTVKFNDLKSTMNEIAKDYLFSD